MRKKLSGVKLAHHKNTANTASQPLPLPKRVRIPMSMHIGAPCSPLVKVRDSICVGQKSVTPMPLWLLQFTVACPERSRQFPISE